MKVYHQSNKMDWETPDSLFQALHREFHFVLDAAATVVNAKCPNFIGPVAHQLLELEDLLLDVERQYPDDGTKVGAANAKKWPHLKTLVYQKFCEEQGIDSLTVPWSTYLPNSVESPVVWLNPPYGRALPKWIEKAHTERFRGISTVMLIPARTDTRYWHRYIWDKTKHRPRQGVSIRFIQGRVQFVGAENGAPFPSAIVIFRDILSLKRNLRSKLNASGSKQGSG